MFNAPSWLYYEFGVDAIYETGRNAYLILLARMCRMVAHGANSLVLGMADSVTSSFQIFRLKSADFI